MLIIFLKNIIKSLYLDFKNYLNNLYILFIYKIKTKKKIHIPLKNKRNTHMIFHKKMNYVFD